MQIPAQQQIYNIPIRCKYVNKTIQCVAESNVRCWALALHHLEVIDELQKNIR